MSWGRKRNALSTGTATASQSKLTSPLTPTPSHDPHPLFLPLLPVPHSYEFKVSYKSIARMFYLEKPTTVAGERSSRFFFVISLDDPIRHGAQRHPHLVMQLDRGSDDLVVPLRLSQEDIDAGRYEGLGKDGASELRGETPKLVAMLLKHVTGKPVFRPGAFMSSSDAKCVRASLKSSEGLLYPLDKSFLFIHKPTTYVRYAEVESVELQRSGGDTGGALASAARTFDLAVNCKALGSEPARTYLFSSVEKSEKDRLKTFLESRGECFATAGAAAAAARVAEAYCGRRLGNGSPCLPVVVACHHGPAFPSRLPSD